MKIFNLINYEVQIDPVAYTLTAFKAVMDKYEDKQYAIAEMAYIYFYTDWASDYVNIVDLKERKKRILSEVFIDKSSKLKIDKITDAAIAFYNERQKTLAYELYEDAKYAINKIREYLRSVDLLALDNNGKPIYDVIKLTKTIESATTLITKMAELEEAIKADKHGSNKLKGIDEIGLFES